MPTISEPGGQPVEVTALVRAARKVDKCLNDFATCLYRNQHVSDGWATIAPAGRKKLGELWTALEAARRELSEAADECE